MTCEGANCIEPGAIYREDFDAVLCNTHAGLSSYGPRHAPFKLKPLPALTFRDRALDLLFAILVIGLSPIWYPGAWIAAKLMGKRVV